MNYLPFRKEIYGVQKFWAFFKLFRLFELFVKLAHNAKLLAIVQAQMEVFYYARLSASNQADGVLPALPHLPRISSNPDRRPGRPHKRTSRSFLFNRSMHHNALAALQ